MNQISVAGVTVIIVTFAILLLFRLRHYFGLTPLYTTLGVFQPIQVLLASSIYSEILPGVVVSPGSIIMFPATLFAILLVYIHEDAVETRKIIYSIVFSNLVMSLLMATFSLQLQLPTTLNFLNLPLDLFNLNIRVTVAGTVALFFDVLLIIFVYEMNWRLITQKHFFCIFLTMAMILVLDTVIFATGAFAGQSQYMEILLSGIIGKVIMAVPFSLIITLYLYYGEPVKRTSYSFKDIFHTLSYRQKFEQQKQKSDMAEVQLSESENYNRTLFNESPIGLALCRMDGSLVDINPAYAQIIGYNIEEALQLSYWEITPKKYFEQERNQLEKLEISGRYGPYEKDYIHKDGRHMPVVLNGLIVDLGGEHFILSSVEDMTESEKLRSQLIQAQKMESIGNLAGGIAHDFNNILSSIIGFTELALEAAPKGSAQREDLEEVYIAGNRAKELVQQILAFARQSDQEIRPVRLSDIVTEVLKLLRPSTPTNIDIKPTINSTAKVMGNTSQLHQVVMNLCTNAIHSLQKTGGLLEIGLKATFVGNGSELKTLELPAGEYVELTVTDNGSGIDSVVIEKIFEPYFTTKGVGEGTGMGLAMVKGIVDAYGGDILVTSELGKRTSFVIRLPIVTGKGDEAKVHDVSTALGTEHILFVDDEPPIARMGSRMLESLGYTVTMRTSSYEALELFREKPDGFDLVITDMTMPSMTGDVLSIELRKIKHDIPIILCTGYSNKINDDGAKLIGIDAFVYKPFTKPDLAKTIREVLDINRTSSV